MHKIIVTLEGGLVQDVDFIPYGIEVEIRDYDIEGMDRSCEEVETDELGEYASSSYTAPFADGLEPHCLVIDQSGTPTPSYYASKAEAEAYIAQHRDWVLSGPWAIPFLTEKE